MVFVGTDSNLTDSFRTKEGALTLCLSSSRGRIGEDNGRDEDDEDDDEDEDEDEDEGALHTV